MRSGISITKKPAFKTRLVIQIASVSVGFLLVNKKDV